MKLSWVGLRGDEQRCLVRHLFIPETRHWFVGQGVGFRAKNIYINPLYFLALNPTYENPKLLPNIR